MERLHGGVENGAELLDQVGAKSGGAYQLPSCRLPP
jgi:hypothetical protein